MQEEEEEDCPGEGGGLKVARILRCYKTIYGTSLRSNIAIILFLYVISVLQCRNYTCELSTNILDEQHMLCLNPE